MSKSKGEVLRKIGSGPIRVITTRQDWETRQIGTGEQAGIAVGQSLVAFMAQDFREHGSLPGGDIWEFTVVEEDGKKYQVYLAGEDIFMLYVPSRIL